MEEKNNWRTTWQVDQNKQHRNILQAKKQVTTNDVELFCLFDAYVAVEMNYFFCTLSYSELCDELDKKLFFVHNGVTWW